MGSAADDVSVTPHKGLSTPFVGAEARDGKQRQDPEKKATTASVNDYAVEVASVIDAAVPVKGNVAVEHTVLA